MPILQFIKRNSSRFISILIAIVGVSVAVLTYVNKDKKELSFIIESTKKIVDLESTPSLTELKIIVGDKEIKVLHVLELKIKNTGNKAILLDDLYDEQIAIATQDETTTFITFDIRQVPYYRSCSFKRYDNFIYLTPDLLNPRDYIELFIFFTQDGDFKTPVFETSIIDGCTKVIDNRSK